MPERYVVRWIPVGDVIKRCQKEGMRDNDGTSFWDWVEPDFCEQSKVCPTFAKAKKVAASVIPTDACGEVWITRQHKELDDMGDFKVWRWTDGIKWAFYHDGETVEFASD